MTRTTSSPSESIAVLNGQHHGRMIPTKRPPVRPAALAGFQLPTSPDVNLRTSRGREAYASTVSPRQYRASTGT